MKKHLLLVLFLLVLFPWNANASTIYQSIMRDNEVRQLPEEYNIFNCITRNTWVGDPTQDTHDSDGTCIVGEGDSADYIKEYTDELEGLYPFEDDKGSMYFFRGWYNNNWLLLGNYEEDYYFYYIDSIKNYEFGTYDECMSKATDPNTHCTDIYKVASKGDPIVWRIIRTNGDKSIRLVYAGTKIDDYSDKINIGASAYNIKQDELKYAGYTYKENDQEVNSSLKTYIDTWYQKVNKTFSKYVVKSTFVNDTSVVHQKCYGSSDYDLCFPGYTRLWYWSEVNENKITPSLKKSNSTAGYGGDYTLDVGTVTGDEMVMAGGSMWGYNTYDAISLKNNFSENKDNYDSRIDYWSIWSMTPGDSYIGRPQTGDDPFGVSSKRQVEMVAAGGCMFTNDVTDYYWVKPVISIDGNVEVVGNGSEENPYRIATVANIEVNISDTSKDINSYFKDLPDGIEWTVENREILDIVNNKIVPKKIGETDIIGSKADKSYVLHVKVTSIINPDTNTKLVLVLVTVLLAIFTLLVTKTKKQITE